MARTITFEGACTRCEGGLWQGRAGYTCHTCGGTGKVSVALKPSISAKLMKANGWGLEMQTWAFQVVTAKGTVTREKYMAKAVQTADRRVFNVGATTGSGWYEHEQPAQLAGSETFVYGVTGKGELIVMHTAHGGYGTTGYRAGRAGGYESHDSLCAVRVTEEAAAAAITELCEREGIELSEHAEASAVAAG